MNRDMYSPAYIIADIAAISFSSKPVLDAFSSNDEAKDGRALSWLY